MEWALGQWRILDVPWRLFIVKDFPTQFEWVFLVTIKKIGWIFHGHLRLLGEISSMCMGRQSICLSWMLALDALIWGLSWFSPGYWREGDQTSDHFADFWLRFIHIFVWVYSHIPIRYIISPSELSMSTKNLHLVNDEPPTLACLSNPPKKTSSWGLPSPFNPLEKHPTDLHQLPPQVGI